MKNLEPAPKLKNEKAWARFWMPYKSISLRLPVYMLDEIKLLANKRDVPYQSLMNVFLAEKIKEEIAA